MCCRGMSYLPLLLVVLSSATFAVTYIIAIYNDDVTPDFPYISDTGTTPPESCIFSQLLNICAVLNLCTIYVRYKLVEVLGVTSHNTKLRRLNKFGLVLGILSAFGISIVANFQETNVEKVHLTGAMLSFVVGVMYLCVQTSISYYMEPDYNGKYICRVRLTLTLVSAVVLLITIASAVIAGNQKEPGTDKLHWKPDEPGFAAHTVSTVGEWCTTLCFMFYFLSFVRDFMKMSFEIKPYMYVKHLDEDPRYPDENTKLLA